MTDPEQKALEMVREWKHYWMDKEPGYFDRAFRIDANMIHHLSGRIAAALREAGAEGRMAEAKSLQSQTDDFKERANNAVRIREQFQNQAEQLLLERDALKAELAALKLSREMEIAANTRTTYSGTEVMRQNEALRAMLDECVEWLCTHEEALTGLDYSKVRGRIWCSACQNYLRSEADTTLPKRARALLKGDKE